MDRADVKNVFLMYNTKEIGTFHFARWERDYNADLSPISKGEHDPPLLQTEGAFGIPEKPT